MSNVVEILVKAKDETKGAFDSADQGASSFGTKLGKASKVAAVGLLALGGAAVGAVGKAEEAAVAQNRLANVLDQMGYGDATDRVSAYADALEKQVAVDGEVIKATQAKLGTFSEIVATADEAGGAFDRATMAALDLAATGFGSAEGNAAALGKALQDPIKGLASLSRMGVTFSKSEQARIKTLVESNKMGEAQNLILSAIEKQVGGTAEETATSSQKMSLAFENIVESLGALLLPHMDMLASIIEKIAGFMENHTETAGILVAALAGLAATVIAVNAAYKLYIVTTKAITLATKAWTVAQRVLNVVMRMNPIGLIITAIAGLIAIVVAIEKKTGFFSKTWKIAWNAIKNGASAVINWVKDNWPKLLVILTGPVGLAVLAIRKHKDKIIGFFKAIPGAIKTAFRYLGSAISTPFTSAFAAVKSLWNSTVGGFGFSVPDWVPKVGGKEFRIPEMAHGGIAGGLISVGERGRELIRVPHGSTVIPNGATEDMLSAAGRPGRLVLELRSSGSRIDDMLLELLRNAIRVRGGDVQVVLGR